MMNFTCPYCNHHSTITNLDQFEHWEYINLNISKLGEVGMKIKAIHCPNKACSELILEVLLTSCYKKYGEHVELSEIQMWPLLPQSFAKPLPDYIPKAIQEDYYEACLIRDLSPKASATLARRCLQGMIRDFHNISKSRLIDEIKELKGKIDQDVWDSIEAVRTVGNIGAHMERDINMMIDVEPEEAQLLIGLIEQLVEEWYISRDERRKRAESLKMLAETKKHA